MRTHTTYTDIKRITHLHSQGLSLEDISRSVAIDPTEVQKVIDARTPKKKTRKKAKPVEEPVTDE